MDTRLVNKADTSSGGESLVSVMRSVQEQLQGVLASFDRVPNADLKDMVVAVERLSWQVFAAQTLLAGEVDARIMTKLSGGPLMDEYGCGSSREFLQKCTLMSRREAGSRIRLGKLLLPEVSFTGERLTAELPYLSTAVQAGAVSPAATKLIAGTLGDIVLQDTVKRDEAERSLVEAATGIDLGTGTLEDLADEEEYAAADIAYLNLLSDYAQKGLLNPLPLLASEEPTAAVVASPALAQDVDGLRARAQEWKQVLDQEGTVLDEKEAITGRSITFGSARGGLVPVRGSLLPEVASGLDSLMDAINSPRNQNNANADDASVIADLLDGDWRTGPQKRHDALAAIITMAASSSEMPSHGGMPVTVLVETSEEALVSGKPSWVYGPGSGKTVLTAEGTWHATCGGAVQYYAKNLAGRIVALGTKQRVFNAHQRRAIVARDGGCVIPGCSTPPAWCEIHHVHAHSEGGRTHTDNGVALCWYHHRTLGTSGWEIRMNQGSPEIKAPKWMDSSQKWQKPRAKTKPIATNKLKPQTARIALGARRTGWAADPPETGGPPE